MPELPRAGRSVRCMARDPGKLSDRPRSGEVETAAADAADDEAVRRALEDIEVAYYLFGGMLRNITAAAERAGRASDKTLPENA